MNIVRVNRYAATELSGLGVPVTGHGPGAPRVFEVPVWGLQLWSIKERIEAGLLDWGRAAKAAVGVLGSATTDEEACDLIDAILTAHAAGGSWSVVMMCSGGGWPTGQAKTKPTIEPGVMVRCVPEGGRGRGAEVKIRVRALSEGYDADQNIQFPREVRRPGGFFVVAGLRAVKAKKTPYYVAEGPARPLLLGSYDDIAA